MDTEGDTPSESEHEQAEQINPQWSYPPTGDPLLRQARAMASDLAVDWVIEKWRGDPVPRCPYCRVQDWWVGGPIQLSTTDGPRASHPSPPMFPVTCSNCGHTVFVNAVIAGIADPPEKDDPRHGTTEGSV
jgi:hypothetical protein